MALKEKNPEPIGLGEAKYAGPERGPFKCEHCQWFRKPTLCGHPTVKETPELPKMNGFAVIKPKGCCNFFRDE